ncbi:MAG: MarR family transcriptional regulator [Rhodocyclaceae bacterium]|nr:MarR family transcriptional regulator [Rhodocyclaceae bacterium]
MTAKKIKRTTVAATVADSETRVNANDHDALRLWLRLLACTNLIEGQVRSRLRVEFDTTLPRFDLMAQLERMPEGLKMGELSKRMMVTGGNVTGITDQLVAEGLVVREDNPADRRAYIVKLTAEGRRQFKRMAEPHEKWIIELLAGLGDAEKKQLFDLLAKMKKHAAIL